LRGGLQLKFGAAIDFTGSNGNPEKETSLHYRKGKSLNQYEHSIVSCGNIISKFDPSEKYMCFGFGAKLKDDKTHHIFHLTLDNNNPYSYGVTGIIKSYENCLNNVTLSGPTYFSPMLRILRTHVSKNMSDYHLFLILTDGVIEDFEETKDEIVALSFLPVSIIIIGVGEANFELMKELSDEGGPIYNSNFQKEFRDCVSFDAFRDFEFGHIEQLAEEILNEIPVEILEYYHLKNIAPNKRIKAKNVFNGYDLMNFQPCNINPDYDEVKQIFLIKESAQLKEKIKEKTGVNLDDKLKNMNIN